MVCKRQIVPSLKPEDIRFSAHWHAISHKTSIVLSFIIATMSEGMIVNPYITGGTFTQVNHHNTFTGPQGMLSQ